MKKLTNGFRVQAGSRTAEIYREEDDGDSFVASLEMVAGRFAVFSTPYGGLEGYFPGPISALRHVISTRVL